jgi:hypothetical protein
MAITRSQPADIFKTIDGRLFDNAEEAHCHERHVRLKALVNKWSVEQLKTPEGQRTMASFGTPMVEALANHIARVVADTPLANG